MKKTPLWSAGRPVFVLDSRLDETKAPHSMVVESLSCCANSARLFSMLELFRDPPSRVQLSLFGSNTVELVADRERS